MLDYKQPSWSERCVLLMKGLAGIAMDEIIVSHVRCNKVWQAAACNRFTVAILYETGGGAKELVTANHE